MQSSRCGAAGDVLERVKAPTTIWTSRNKKHAVHIDGACPVDTAMLTQRLMQQLAAMQAEGPRGKAD
jgi:hypothetical protein